MASGLVAVVSYQQGFAYSIVLLGLLLIGLVLLGVYLSRVQVVRPEAAGQGARLVRLAAEIPYKRHLATVALDLVLIVLAYYAAYVLRFEGGLASEQAIFVRTVPPLVVVQILALALSGAYRGLWRYTGLADLIRLVGAVTVGSAAGVVYFVLVVRFAGLSRAVFVLDWLLLCALVSVSRVSFRLLGVVLRRPQADARRVLIYGAGDGGELILREIGNNAGWRRQAVGFVDDDPGKVGARIHEVPVLGTPDSLDELLVRHEVSEVVVSSRKIPDDRLRRIQAVCAARSVAVVRASVRVDWDGLDGPPRGL